MDEGSKIEGNSIWYLVRAMDRSVGTELTYQPFVLRQEDSDPSVNLANGERHQHGGESWMTVRMEVRLERQVY